MYQIAHQISQSGGVAYFVGGCVRDEIMQQEVYDYDIEVYDVSPLALEQILACYGTVRAYGKSFGVYSIDRLPVEFALPRKEFLCAVDEKNGCITVSSPPKRDEQEYMQQCYSRYQISIDAHYPFRHTDFCIMVDPAATTEAASLRRDFTMNSIMKNVLTGEIIDHFHGIRDIKYKTIRHIQEHFFIQDALRGLRAAQFAARFDFTIAPETQALCATLSLKNLPQERIHAELAKLLSAPFPANGLTFLLDTKLFHQLFPNLAGAYDASFSPIFGNDIFSKVIPQLLIPQNSQANIALFCLPAVLRGADLEQTYPALELLCHNQQQKKRQMLLLSQMKEFLCAPSPYAIRKAAYYGILDVLLKISHAISACTGLPNQAYHITTAIAHELTPIAHISGKDLIAQGMPSSPIFSTLLAKALDLQFQGYSKQAIMEILLDSSKIQ